LYLDNDSHVLEGQCTRRRVSYSSYEVREQGQADPLGSNSSGEDLRGPHEAGCIHTLVEDDVEEYKEEACCVSGGFITAKILPLEESFGKKTAGKTRETDHYIWRLISIQ
jgi:hypothetical protein